MRTRSPIASGHSVTNTRLLTFNQNLRVVYKLGVLGHFAAWGILGLGSIRTAAEFEPTTT